MGVKKQQDRIVLRTDNSNKMGLSAKNFKKQPFRFYNLKAACYDNWEGLAKPINQEL
jgi:hypothetical protein